MMAWLAQPFLKEIGVSMKNYGFIWALLNVTVGVFAFATHQLEKKVSSFTSLLIIGIITLSTYLLMGSNLSYYSLIILFVFYANRGYATALLRNYININTVSNVRATVLSVRSFIIRISFAIIAPFIGWVADKHSLEKAFMCMGVISGMASIYCLIWFYKNPTKILERR